MRTSWKKEEVKLLFENYSANCNKAYWARLLPNRTWDAVKLMANKLGLFQSDEQSRQNVSADLSMLLEETPEAYYWVGFLMADGCISHDTMRLKFMLAQKDKLQMQRFADFIKCKSEIKKQVAVQDKYVVPKLIEKFDFKPRKTYNPPNIKIESDDLFVAFLIGYIDGDGNIVRLKGRKICNIRIKCHSSWLNNLQIFSERVSDLAKVPIVDARINKQGYANLCLSNHVVSRFLKNKTVELKLPVMERKWEQIDCEFVTRAELAREHRKMAIKMYSGGKSYDEIAELMGVTYSGVYAIINR